jgi:hypothetical protein
MVEQDALEWVKVREVTGVFPSSPAVDSAVDELLLAGFDRADIDVVAGAESLRKRIGDTPVPAVELAAKPDAPRREFVAPEDTAAVFALCVAVLGCLGAMIGAFSIIGSGGTSAWTLAATGIGGAAGCGLGILIAHGLGWRWTEASRTPAGTDGFILWVRVRTRDREKTARHILSACGADAVRTQESVIQKHLDDLPLGMLRPDPWLGNERLGGP